MEEKASVCFGRNDKFCGGADDTVCRGADGGFVEMLRNWQPTNRRAQARRQGLRSKVNYPAAPKALRFRMRSSAVSIRLSRSICSTSGCTAWNR